MTQEQKRLRHGQHTLEYAVLIAVVAAAVVAMQTYVRRAIQANLKNVEEEVNASLEEQPGQGQPPPGGPGG